MKKTFKILLLTMLVIAGISIFSNVKAATASIKASKNPASVGDSVTITVTINAAAWNLKATGSGISGGNYVGYTNDANNATKTETLKLDTSSAGTKTIILSGDVTDGDTGVTSSINSSVSVVINEKAPTNNSGNNNQSTQKSSDTTLKSVTVSGTNYTLGKSMTVGADTSSVAIKATPTSSKATVSGTGTKELVTGTNKFTLKVTAENGTQKSYTITIIREEYVEDNPNVIDPNQEEENLKLTSIQIEGAELSPEFNEDIFEYSTEVINLDEIKISAISNIEDANIEITGNTGLVEGQNLVVITVTKGEKQVQYNIKVNKVLEEIKEDNEEEEDNEQAVGFFDSKGGKIALGCTGGVGAVTVVGICIWKAKSATGMASHARRASSRRMSFDDFDD